MASSTQTTTERSLPPLLLAFLCFWIPMLLFLRIAGEIVERETINVDFVILQLIHSQTSSALDLLFLAITNIGAPLTLMLIALALALVAWKQGRRQQAFIWFFGVGGANLANFLLKLLFARERPNFWESAVVEHNYSFPSGHAMASAAFAVCVFIVFWKTRWRWQAFLAGFTFTLLVGLSRLYFGVHFPTDIVAGWAVSSLWVFLVSSIVSNRPFKLRSRLDKLRASVRINI